MPRTSLSRRAPVALGAAIALTAVLLPALPAAAEPAPACVAPNAPMQVTADCIDPLYAQPVIDAETDETSPVPHHRVSGHFEGTNIQFNIYLHARSRQGASGTVDSSSTPTRPRSRRARTRHGRAIAPSDSRWRVAGTPCKRGTTSSHSGTGTPPPPRSSRRQVAADYYGSDREIFGYLYGPSGGSFQTVGAAENTDGVWQGFVPMVQAVPTPNSYNFNGRSAAELILGDKADQIRDALLPGGSGDPYATLDEAERAMLTELHLLGIPLEGLGEPRLSARLRPRLLRLGPRLRRPARLRPDLRRRLLERARATSAPRTSPLGAAGARPNWPRWATPSGTAGTSPSASRTAISSPPPTRDGSRSTSSATRTARRSTRSAPSASRSSPAPYPGTPRSTGRSTAR